MTLSALTLSALTLSGARAADGQRLSDAFCRVCAATAPRRFAVIDRQTYLRCEACLATLLSVADLPDPAKERAVYDQHQNQPDDPGYCAFLSRLTQQLLPRLAKGSQGLDYGCGPGPALAKMLAQQGFAMRVYDPIYVSDSAALDARYDFITCTEVVEHFHHPQGQFQRLHRLLKPGGWLGVMTQFQTDDSAFAGWYYRRDPTHVTFYREATFATIAKQLGWQFDSPVNNIALFRRGPC